MVSYIKFELDDGTVVFIESTDVVKGSSGLIPGVKSEHAIDQNAISFDKSVTAIRKMATSLVSNLLSGFDDRPEEVGINFGIKASSEVSSLVVTRGGQDSNFNVSLRWRHNGEEGRREEKAEDKIEEKKEEEKKEEEKKLEPEA